MRTYQFEATQSAEGGGVCNWGKFLVGVMDEEWAWESAIDGVPLLHSIGMNTRALWVLDLQTCEGAAVVPGGNVRADLYKHAIWVCPMFEPFLEWLYKQDIANLDALPRLVQLPDAPFEFTGHRRPGPDGEPE